MKRDKPATWPELEFLPLPALPAPPGHLDRRPGTALDVREPAPPDRAAGPAPALPATLCRPGP
ncbi:MAG: hypothetical protein ACRDUW_17985 [Pseudonocardiaceae bacterium]